jgi:hypothetical protein
MPKYKSIKKKNHYKTLKQAYNRRKNTYKNKYRGGMPRPVMTFRSGRVPRSSARQPPLPTIPEASLALAETSPARAEENPTLRRMYRWFEEEERLNAETVALRRTGVSRQTGVSSHAEVPLTDAVVEQSKANKEREISKLIKRATPLLLEIEARPFTRSYANMKEYSRREHEINIDIQRLRKDIESSPVKTDSRIKELDAALKTYPDDSQFQRERLDARTDYLMQSRNAGVSLRDQIYITPNY